VLSLSSSLGGRGGPGAGVGMGHLAARFVLGEVAAALLSVHEAGFSFNDLKPENVLLTALGHVKLADFGACRPLDAGAEAVLRESLRSNVGCLRNGDWREDGAAVVGKQNDAFADLGRGNGVEAGAAGETERAEGTPGFLPPEMLRNEPGCCGGGLGADAWALGCVAYFCLLGRPLFFGSSQEVLAQMAAEAGASFVPVASRDGAGAGAVAVAGAGAGRHVNFDSRDGGVRGLLAALERDAQTRSFLQGLLCCEPRDRLAVRDAASHPYLLAGPSEAAAEPSDQTPLAPLRLHFGQPLPLPQPPPHGAGAGAGSGGSEDPQWARRQFSVLWSPHARRVRLAR